MQDDFSGWGHKPEAANLERIYSRGFYSEMFLGFGLRGKQLRFC